MIVIIKKRYVVILLECFSAIKILRKELTFSAFSSPPVIVIMIKKRHGLSCIARIFSAIKFLGKNSLLTVLGGY
jgi:hypothetical protein